MKSTKADVVAEHMRGLSGYNARGEEIPDPKPMALPVGFERPEALVDTIRRLVRSEELASAAEAEMETFDEADDFDVEEDLRVDSPYEDDFEPGLPGVAARHDEIKGGMVQEYPKERLEAARETIRKAKENKSGSGRKGGSEGVSSADKPDTEKGKGT